MRTRTQPFGACKVDDEQKQELQDDPLINRNTVAHPPPQSGHCFESPHPILVPGARTVRPWSFLGWFKKSARILCSNHACVRVRCRHKNKNNPTIVYCIGCANMKLVDKNIAQLLKKVRD